MQWDYEAGAPVDFNVHYHLGKEVFFPALQSAVRSGKDLLAVKLDQDYCWMWTHQSARATTLALRSGWRNFGALPSRPLAPGARRPR